MGDSVGDTDLAGAIPVRLGIRFFPVGRSLLVHPK